MAPDESLLSPTHRFTPIGSMHYPDHASVLPDHVDLLPTPGSPREAEILLLLLEMGLYLKCAPAEGEKVQPDEGKGPAFRNSQASGQGSRSD